MIAKTTPNETKKPTTKMAAFVLTPPSTAPRQFCQSCAEYWAKAMGYKRGVDVRLDRSQIPYVAPGQKMSPKFKFALIAIAIVAGAMILIEIVI